MRASAPVGQPVPPLSECDELVPYAEWAAARGCVEGAGGACGPVDRETLDRWGTSAESGPVEWVVDALPAEFGSDNAEVDLPEEVIARENWWGSDERDVRFCVREEPLGDLDSTDAWTVPRGKRLRRGQGRAPAPRKWWAQPARLPEYRPLASQPA